MTSSPPEVRCHAEVMIIVSIQQTGGIPMHSQIDGSRHFVTLTFIGFLALNHTSFQSSELRTRTENSYQRSRLTSRLRHSGVLALNHLYSLEVGFR
jgi:hypothetical protein